MKQPEISYNLLSISNNMMSAEVMTKSTNSSCKLITRAYKYVRHLMITIYGNEMMRIFPSNMIDFDADILDETSFSDIHVNVAKILENIRISNIDEDDPFGM